MQTNTTENIASIIITASIWIQWQIKADTRRWPNAGIMICKCLVSNLSKSIISMVGTTAKVHRDDASSRPGFYFTLCTISEYQDETKLAMYVYNRRCISFTCIELVVPGGEIYVCLTSTPMFLF